MINKYAENIREELKNYLVQSKLKSLVVGISGGIDSTLVVALAKPVCKELGVKLIGKFIFIESNKDEEVHRAINVGREFCDEFGVVDLTNEFLTIKPVMKVDVKETEKEEKIRLGNVKARLRMIYLYNIAQANKGMVLSTDNLTELLLGFWTLHGDVGDYGMIQNLWKTEVYEMSEYISKEIKDPNVIMDVVNADATDGLGITKTDLDQILPDWRDRHKTTREGYKEVDDILKDMENNKESEVVKRFENTKFKRENPYNIPREKIIK